MMSNNKQMYSWRPFFREVAEKLCKIGEDTQHRNEKIIEVARDIFEEDSQIIREEHLDKGGVDPFSIVYTLAATFKGSDSKKFPQLERATKVLKMSATAEDITGWEFEYVTANSTLFHTGGSYVLDKKGKVDRQPTREATVKNLNQIWQLFSDVYNAKTYRDIDDERFRETLLFRPDFGLAKFTQVMFLMNSSVFFPIDEKTLYMPFFSANSPAKMRTRIENRREKFSTIMQQITDTFIGCELYEVCLFACLIRNPWNRLTVNDRIWNINAFTDNHYEIFEQESKVFTAEWAPDNDESKDLYRVTAPQRGDLMIARQSSTFKMLGVVLDNGYADKGKWVPHDQGGYIEVVWIQRQDELHTSQGGKASGDLRATFCEHHQGISFYPRIDKLIKDIKKKQKEITETKNNIENEYPEHIALLLANKNLILTGAPGTGKTYLAKQLARYLLGTQVQDLAQNENYAFVQFHPAYDYTDFVEGLRPIHTKDSNIGFELKDGLFKAFCKHAADADDEDEPHVCIIDEINRGEISKIFGELFFSIDPGYRGEDGRVTTQYANILKEGDIFEDGFYVPENVYIIGTMNDIDRSVESFDFAMRRRFAWKEIKYDDTPNMLEKLDGDLAGVAKERIKSLNDAISKIEGLGDAYHIGGAYFMKIKGYTEMGVDDAWSKLWNNHLQPLLGEYLRTLPDKVDNLQKLEDAYNLLTSQKTEDS